MSERKSQTKYIPLRVRFRPSTEAYQYGREHTNTSVNPPPNTQTLVPDLAHIPEAERHAQQIKELIRLGNLLHAELSLDAVLEQIAASVAACTGFHMLNIRLIDASDVSLSSVAFAGVSEEDQHILRASPFAIEALRKLMRPEFRIGQSYFISHEYVDVFADKVVVISKTVDDYGTGGWHPEDSFFVPLYSPRRVQKLLGCLSLDDPEDGKVPTVRSVEIVELFANLAALAIDNAVLFHEREAERQALEQALVLFYTDLEQLQQGNLHARIHSTHEKLHPLADAINTTVDNFSSIVQGMKRVTRAVDEHSHDIQRNSESLMRVATHRELQVQHISQTVGDVTSVMGTVSEQFATLDKHAIEAEDVTIEAQTAVDRAVEGMGQVRETTMKSLRTMKSLSESGQEINETIVTLTDLTMRMHLLALNAAIEATRAGEHGQGFTIIAQEIRTLAANSAEAARKVGNYVRTIQQETTAVSQSFEESTQKVVVQTELVTQASISLDAIGVVTERLKNLIHMVCKMVEEQFQDSSQMLDTTDESQHMMAAVARHTREMQQSTAHLVDLTNVLHSRVAELRIRER